MAIKTKEIISIQERYNMIQEILDYAIVDMKLDVVAYEIGKVVNIAKYYSNFTLEKNEDYVSYVKTYDSLMSNGKYYKYVLPNINQYELKLIDDMLDKEISNKTSLSYLFIDKFANFDFEETKKQLAELDLTKLDGINSIMNTLQGRDESVGDR
jgi:hypothetical protein